MKFRIKYWSCSKFADLIRGSKKPYALTSEEWQNWRKEQEKNSPIRFWISDTFLNKIQNFIYFPNDLYKSIKYYMINRFIDKTHYLKTNLSPGQYYELDDRIMHGLFNELVDFVEIENAAINMRVSKKRFLRRRNPQAGIDHLNWAASLTFGSDYGVEESDKTYNKPTPQAKSAKEVLELYSWWKQRPNRPDACEISGWNVCCNNKSDYTKEQKNKIFKKLQKIEENYEKEDDEMIMRLIKIRKELWT